jgi:hypothetical protein
MAKTRITISLDTDSPSDVSILKFLSGLPRRTRSEIIKEVLIDALLKETDSAEAKPPPDAASGPGATDPDEIIEKLF